jgi:hypothetical protein
MPHFVDHRHDPLPHLMPDNISRYPKRLRWTTTPPGARAACRAWFRLIKKIYEVDPLICPVCSGPMRIVAFIEKEGVVRKILEHLKLWEDQEPRSPPTVPEQVDVQYVPFFDS